MKRYCQIVDATNTWVARIIGWTMVVVMLVTVVDVLLRRLFNTPILWAFDISSQLFAFHFMLATACALLAHEHVSINIFRDRLPVRVQAGLELFCYLVLFFPFVVALLVFGWSFVERSWSSNETSIGFIQIPLYYVKGLIPVTGAMLCLQGLSMVFKLGAVLKTGRAV